MPDFLATNHGTIITLTPLTEAGREWAFENLSDDCTLGRSYAIEPRYFDPIADGIAAAGLTLT